ncbi:hypothetical protein JST56_02805 [Candidatus Dependentiae bacterium]|nr:hypothetical protein [Candidatus Dependentiae bacterium]
MKLFQFITFTALCITTLSLHAQYPEFNIGEGINECVLSPDGKFLVNTNQDDRATKLWNAHTGQLLNTFKTRGQLFFSSDSTTLCALKRNKIQRYHISESEIIPQEPIALTDHGFLTYPKGSFVCKNIDSEPIFTCLKTSDNACRFSWGLFLSTLLPDGSTKTVEFKRENIRFYIHSTQANTMTPDGKKIAIACEKCSYGVPYIHVVDVETQQLLIIIN